VLLLAAIFFNIMNRCFFLQKYEELPWFAPVSITYTGQLPWFEVELFI
jgi:hypothetical protein